MSKDYSAKDCAEIRGFFVVFFKDTFPSNK